MGPGELAAHFARGHRVQELTAAGRSVGSNRIYRIWGEERSRILKVYGTPTRERREKHALDALVGIPGLPKVLERGVDEDMHWALFADAGQWNLASLPENDALARQAGQILRAVHSADTTSFSNLPRGIDQEWVSVDFVSTFRRIERYRGRLNLALDLIEAARGVRPPFASTPRLAHTDPLPEKFIVDNVGTVTLINWEWATLAPPEWDLSRALWLVGLRSGINTAQALAAGYGSVIDPVQLDRWTVYHSGMMLLYGVENRLDGRLDDLHYLSAELQRAVAGSRSAA